VRACVCVSFSLSISVFQECTFIFYLNDNKMTSLLTLRRVMSEQFPNRARYQMCAQASGRERETETHLRATTRRCDLRRPCIAGNRSGGREHRRHFYTRRRTST